MREKCQFAEQEVTGVAEQAKLCTWVTARMFRVIEIKYKSRFKKDEILLLSQPQNYVVLKPCFLIVKLSISSYIVLFRFKIGHLKSKVLVVNQTLNN